MGEERAFAKAILSMQGTRIWYYSYDYVFKSNMHGRVATPQGAVGGWTAAALRVPHIPLGGLREAELVVEAARGVLPGWVVRRRACALPAVDGGKVVGSATTTCTEVAENDTNREHNRRPVTQTPSGKSATSSPSEWDFYQPDDRTETDVKRATVEGLGDESCSHSYRAMSCSHNEARSSKRGGGGGRDFHRYPGVFEVGEKL
ncbi:hypothetical protein FIBSPDRAFT_904861 [Athelia psychrophila]|uniref:Uncharacterized protein n=1 Tax=Athelia psychrophila TaxID=1759441 RepID=A0A167U717_9AGAM|nr:hypothetical protein FIBSPDRAFT_904861 [Fibularhizoctonia sp. CBS 109695]